MKSYQIIAAIIFLISNLVHAGTKEDIAKCAAMESDASRVICFDNLSKSLGVDKPKITVSTGKGKWVVRKEQSLIDDSINVTVAVTAEDIVQSGYNKVLPILIVRCAENKTEVFINWDLYLGMDKTKMLTRFDQEKANTKTWNLSTDNNAVFVKGSYIEFAKKIMKHDKLLLQITPFNQNPVMATFDIRGLSEAIKPLKKACHW